jgi:hypothetical protein
LGRFPLAANRRDDAAFLLHGGHGLVDHLPVQSGQLGNILGAAVSVKKGVYVAGTAATQSAAGVPAVVGIAGDWDEAKWGVIGTLTGSISEEATLTYTDANSQTVTLALWQQNMFAVRFEIELALMIRDINKFVLLTGAVPTGA